MGNGDGTFQQQVGYATAVGNPQQILVGDFNGDGKLDLAVATGGNVSNLLGNGDGTFKSHVDYPAVGGAIAAGDFNGDGKLDLAVGGISTASSFVGAVSILLGNGDGTFQSPVPYLTGGVLGVNSIAVSDFNQDSKLDLAAGPGASAGGEVILLGNGDGTFQQATEYLLGSISLQGLTVGDFNGDGSPDWAAPDSDNQTVGVMLSAAFKAVSPGSLNFGSQGIGTTSAPQTIAISNPSNVKFTIASISPSANFAETNTCGASLSPGASCAVTVTFSPAATGSQSGTITITDNTRIRPLAIAVRGIGVNGPFLSTFPARQNFSPQIVGTAGNPAAIVLANTGNASLTITGISTAGTNSSDFSQTNNCGSSLSAGSFCTVNVTFMPTAGGSRIANLTIGDSAPGSPHSASLEGTGLAQPDFTIGAASGSPTSQTISAGQTAKFSLVLAPTGSFTGTVNLSCTMTPVVNPAPICSLSSSSVQISGSGTQPVTVKVGTTAPMTSVALPHVTFPSGPMPLIWTPALLGSIWLWVRIRKRQALAAPVMVLAFLFSLGCGGGSSSTHATPRTPTGTYTATITAGAGNVSHHMAVQVIVE